MNAIPQGLEGFAWQPASRGWVVCLACGWWSDLVSPGDADGRAARHRERCGRYPL